MMVENLEAWGFPVKIGIPGNQGWGVKGYKIVLIPKGSVDHEKAAEEDFVWVRMPWLDQPEEKT